MKKIILLALVATSLQAGILNVSPTSLFKTPQAFKDTKMLFQ